MDNQFANFKPIELNPSPSKEEIAKYYLENQIKTNNEFIDNFLKISEPQINNNNFNNTKSDYNIVELLKASKDKIPAINAPVSTDISDKATYIMNYFLNKGLTKEQASGILGNLQAESGLNTEALGDNGTSFGIAQWHKTRYNNLRNFATQNNKAISDLDLQLDYLWHELNTSESAAFNHLLNTRTVEDAAKTFAHKFERMKTYSPKRETYALNFYNTLN